MYTQSLKYQGRIQKEGAEETDDAVLHHSGSICDQTLDSTLRSFQKYRKKGGATAPLAPLPKSAHEYVFMCCIQLTQGDTWFALEDMVTLQGLSVKVDAIGLE